MALEKYGYQLTSWNPSLSCGLSKTTHTMKVYVLIVISFATASLASGAGYDKINKYLVAQVANDDVSDNMAAAIEWLKKQENKKLPFLSSMPASDLRKFTALQRIIDGAKCDRSDYEILNANERAVDLYALYYDRNVVRRVDKVMQKIFEDHARKCQQVYPVRYLEKQQQLDSEVTARVDNIVRTILERGKTRVAVKLYHNPEQLFGDYIARDFTIGQCVGKDYLWLAIKYNSEGDPDAKYLYRVPDEITGKRVVHTEKIKKLTQKYLIEPCKSYVAHYGPDIFVPARLDVEFNYPDDVKKDSSRDYYIAWASFAICKELAQDIAASIVAKSV